LRHLQHAVVQVEAADGAALADELGREPPDDPGAAGDVEHRSPCSGDASSTSWRASGRDQAGTA
jgi:hypothetical protein